MRCSKSKVSCPVSIGLCIANGSIVTETFAEFVGPSMVKALRLSQKGEMIAWVTAATALCGIKGPLGYSQYVLARWPRDVRPPSIRDAEGKTCRWAHLHLGEHRIMLSALRSEHPPWFRMRRDDDRESNDTFSYLILT